MLAIAVYRMATVISTPDEVPLRGTFVDCPVRHRRRGAIASICALGHHSHLA